MTGNCHVRFLGEGLAAMPVSYPTPVEGERLQGYPDDWTKYGADGNIIADTARYRAIGNSICVYCAERLYIGIIRILQEEEKDNERKDESLL